MSGPMLFREYCVHHAAPDGIIVQMPGNGGFGKLTVETLGGDELAQALLKRLVSCQRFRATARLTRDTQQYRLLSIQLLDLWSGAATYASPVATLLSCLFRKNVLIALGTTVMAHVVKSTQKRGTVLSLPCRLAAVAALEDVSEDSTSLEVRLLNYDVKAGVANVTTRVDIVDRTPGDMNVLKKILSSLQAGDVVSASVLLSCTDDNCAIVEVPCEDGKYSLIGYYIYNWPGSGQTPAEVPVVGSCQQLTVEFVPEDPLLQEVLPFVILSSHRKFAALPDIRVAPGQAHGCGKSTAVPTTLGCKGLLGRFPWREGKRQRDAYSESDDDGGDSDNDKNAKGSSQIGNKVRKRKLEEAIDAYERSMDTAVPSSEEEFRRLLLASPNNSYLWVQWMSYHVSLQQYEEARLVAEKALQTIGLRETDERLNVWVAYMNLENMHGTAESLSSVFKRTVEHSLDKLVVYERLADIFKATHKSNQLLALCRTMVSKFRDAQRTWERLGVVLVDQNKRDQLKRMMKDMGGALKRDEYALTVVHVAVYEYRNGSVENGRALLEGLIMRMPKKSDVWSVYLDQELGLLARRAAEAAVPLVRSLFERAVATNFSAKVMQKLLTRFMAFEKAYGTPADVERVRARARSYVEAKISSSVGTDSTLVVTNGGGAADAELSKQHDGDEHGMV